MNIIIATYGNILIYNLKENNIKSFECPGDYFETLVINNKVITICKPEYKKYSDNFYKELFYPNNKEALEYLDKAAKDKNLSKKINDFAILKSGYIMLDNAEITNIEDKLSSILNSTGPFSFYAKEIIALAYYRDNRYQESSKKFSEIANDASSPRNIASRSKIFSEQILSYDNVK